MMIYNSGDSRCMILDFRFQFSKGFAFKYMLFYRFFEKSNLIKKIEEIKRRNTEYFLKNWTLANGGSRQSTRPTAGTWVKRAGRERFREKEIEENERIY